MPQKNRLASRQERVLRKIGLMPLTSTKEISTRFGISINNLKIIERLHAGRLETKRGLIEKFSRDPNKNRLLTHPKLWALHRTMELAPLLTAREIHEQLEREKKHHPHLSSLKIPSENMINLTIKNLKLRTEEQEKILLRKRYDKRRRPINELTPEQRQMLADAAKPLIERYWSKIRRNYGDELADIIRDHIQDETKYVRIPAHLSKEEMEHAWLAYLKKGQRYFFLRGVAILRSRTKGKRRIQFPEGEIPNIEIEALQPIEREMEFPPDITFPTRLSRREGQVLQLLKEGKTRKQIAVIQGVGTAAIGATVSRIRKKIKIGGGEETPRPSEKTSLPIKKAIRRPLDPPKQQKYPETHIGDPIRRAIITYLSKRAGTYYSRGRLKQRIREEFPSPHPSTFWKKRVMPQIQYLLENGWIEEEIIQGKVPWYRLKT